MVITLAKLKNDIVTASALERHISDDMQNLCFDLNNERLDEIVSIQVLLSKVIADMKEISDELEKAYLDSKSE